MRGWAFGLVVTAGCAVSEERFLDRMVELACPWAVECDGAFADVPTCLAQLRPPEIPEGCVFEADLARECLGDIEDVGTDCDTEPLDSDACESVYQCNTPD